MGPMQVRLCYAFTHYSYLFQCYIVTVAIYLLVIASYIFELFLLVKLILKPRSEILESLTSKDDTKEDEVDKSDEQETSASQSQLSSSSEDESSEPGLLSYIV